MALTIISFLTILLTIFYVAVVLFFKKGWEKIPLHHSTKVANTTRVSILIAARNEEDKIGDTIKDLLLQKYPRSLTEIIVVDDHSTDRTAEIISAFQTQGVLLIRLNEDQPLNSYKKKAISEAINIAKGELIVTTDADCRMGSEWLSSIVSSYEQGGWKLISSPVVFFEERNHFERLQTLEFLYLIGLGASSIGNKVPSTCNGANLAYRKDVFEELNGFQGIDDLASGDDELFLHKVASRYPDKIGFCKSREAVVFTHAKPNLKEFIRQRKRWASKSTRYKNKSIIALGVSIWLFNLLIFANFMLGFYDQGYFTLCVVAIVSKFIVENLFLKKMVSFIQREKLIWYLPLLTLIHIIYIIFIGLAGNSGKYIWKDRRVR